MRLSKDVGNTHYTYLYQNGLLVQERIGNQKLDYSYTSNGQILDDNGNFISNEQIIEHQYWGSLSTEVNNIAGPTSTLLGSVGYSTLGTSYLGCASSPFSCLSYQSNPYLNNYQKTHLTCLEILCAGSGVAFAMIIANLWNPVGWAALAVTAAGIGLAALTSYTLSQQEIAWETENKEKWGCYY